MALFDGILKTPLTDLQFAMLPLYFMKERVPLCAKLQMKYVDCVEAYGMKQSLNKCGDLYFDLIECSQSSYQSKRVAAIRARRKELYNAGKLDKLYEENPPIDAYLFL
ncbi:hypothetical protein RUM44_011697 [Polyplax serrata]|uniref:NADH dehydrogenase [ubiquinone] iron-sulfur protein 5 n=1 Tax=Polyplax serrata TaxID=468196 RepID=A0ABR1AQR7_POLSC